MATASVAAPAATSIGTEWLWEALVSCRHAHSVVTQLAPADFDWNGVHSVYGTPLMATVNEIVRSGQVNREVRPVLQWCLRQGADPRRTAQTARGYSGGWGNGTDEFPHVPRVPHAGRSAITLVLGLITVLERISIYEHKGKYQDQLSAAKQLLGVFAQFRAVVPSRPVAEAALEMWESVRADQERADVELHVTGTAEDGTGGLSGLSEDGSLRTVHAHSLVLCHASPVLRASLTSGMLEGQTHALKVPGADLEAVELLLAILYSGMLPVAAPLAQQPHNWDVGDEVEANWRGRGRWWVGRIVATHDDGGCDIIYDGEGGFSEKHVQPMCLRSVGKASWSGTATAPPAGATFRGCSNVNQVRVQLVALDIAHRWQVGYAVTLLEHAIAQQFREGQWWFVSVRDYSDHMRTFELTWEAATLKELPLLRAACRHLACEAPEVRRQYERGGFGSMVTRELRGLFW